MSDQELNENSSLEGNPVASSEADKAEQEQQFWDVSDQLIELANTCCEKVDPSIVNEALLYATTRFASFLVASNSEDRKAFQDEKDEAFNYLSRQFRTMLGESLKDYDDNFKVYTRVEETLDKEG